MKIKWIELTEDDPIFKRGFVISSPNIKSFKKEVHDDKNKKEIKTKRTNKKNWGVKSPNFIEIKGVGQNSYPSLCKG